MRAEGAIGGLAFLWRAVGHQNHQLCHFVDRDGYPASELYGSVALFVVRGAPLAPLPDAIATTLFDVAPTFRVHAFRLQQ